MLSRTADHLFWMARYTERAENTARMLDVNVQTSMLPQSAGAAQGWRALLGISELQYAFDQKYQLAGRPRRDRLHGARSRQPVVHRRLPDGARKRPRRARHADHGSVGNPEPDLAGHAAPPESDLLETDPSKFFEWVKYRSHLSRGVTLGTMLRTRPCISSAWAPSERADNTARILDVKYHGGAPKPAKT
jgi:uncharacterized alpha-E superfamily protein